MRVDFCIKRDIFIKAIDDANKVIRSNTLNPLLSGIKLEANEKELTLTGSNGEIYIMRKVSTQIEEELTIMQGGSVVVSAKSLHQLIKKLPLEIHIQVDQNNRITIRSGEVKSHISGFDSSLFPSIPAEIAQEVITLEGKDLLQMVKQTTFAASNHENRPVLTSVHLSFQKESIRAVATDSHRLALREFSYKNHLQCSCNVPKTAFSLLAKVLSHETSPVKISIHDRSIVFEAGDLLVYSKLIEGHYPNVDQFIPKNAPTILSVNKLQLQEGIERACLFANEWKNHNIHLEVRKGDLHISSSSSDLGGIEEKQTLLSVDGEKEYSVTLDGTFLIEALKAVEEEKIRIGISGSMRPIFIRPLDHEQVCHVLSPVRSH